MAIVFKDLQKLVSYSQQQQQSRLFERLRDKPFWIWNIEEHKKEDIKQIEIRGVMVVAAEEDVEILESGVILV